MKSHRNRRPWAVRGYQIKRGVDPRRGGGIGPDLWSQPENEVTDRSSENLTETIAAASATNASSNDWMVPPVPARPPAEVAGSIRDWDCAMHAGSAKSIAAQTNMKHAGMRASATITASMNRRQSELCRVTTGTAPPCDVGFYESICAESTLFPTSEVGNSQFLDMGPPSGSVWKSKGGIRFLRRARARPP